MKDLSKKEFIAQLIGTLVLKYRNEREYDKALRYAELMLALNPRSITGLVHKAAILGWLGHTMQERIVNIERRHPSFEESQELKLYKVESDSLIEYTRSLGWEPETPESREQYLRTVREAKEDNSD